MFEFLKKTKGSKQSENKVSQVNAKSSNLIQSSVEQVLQSYNAEHQQDNVSATHENNRPLSELISTSENGDSVTVTLRLASQADPEALQRLIGIKLAPYGINEINLNVSLPSESASPPHKMSANRDSTISAAKGNSNVLPKTTNAAANHTAREEPPISKRAPTQASLQPHPRIKHIIVIASGKGGVGKSTTTVNVALALQQLGNRVGVLDADIYGPSLPDMLGVKGIKPQLENEQFVPIDAYGMPMLSIGSLLDDDNTPVAWRGPKATGALMQLFNQTNWPMLDYLLIDMPPGTGDIQLTLAQRIPVTGAVIVTTPQHIALMDAQKGIEMFNKTNIPVIGVVENMALHTCSNCGHTDAIFGAGGGESIAEAYQVPMLGQLPLASSIRAHADNGEPSVVANSGEGDDFARFYVDIARNIDANIAKFTKQRDDGRIF